MAYRKKSRSGNNNTESPGHDAFLDIVANLVGILIILVVIVGAHAGASLGQKAVAIDTQLDEKILKMQEQIAQEQSVTQELLSSIQQLEAKTLSENNMLNSLANQRHKMLIALDEIRQQTKTRMAEHDEEQQKQLETLQQRQRLEYQLGLLESELSAVQSVAKTEAKSIVHYPTPLARTVFRDEIHCRVLNGRLVWVPINELIGLMRSEWKLKAEKLKNAEQTVETVGPIEQFRLQYYLSASNRQQVTELGPIQERSVEFQRFVILPTADNLGESTDKALQPDSPFMQRLSQLDPQKTTISIWVYSDSFEEFNQLKQVLRERGFQTAAWPLGMGKTISGGPNGYRSSAQ